MTIAEIKRFYKKDPPTQTWTNGLYVISAKLFLHSSNIKKSRLVGDIIDIANNSKHVSGSIYKIGTQIDFPLYNTEKSIKPQFITMGEVRQNKIDSILKNN